MNHSLNICIRKKSRIWRIWKHSFQFYAALSFHVMSFKAFSTLCCGKGSHKTILGQIYISASFLPYQMKRQKQNNFWVFASLSFPYWGLQFMNVPKDIIIPERPWYFNSRQAWQNTDLHLIKLSFDAYVR